MNDKCKHETAIQHHSENGASILTCTWACGQVLIELHDGITTRTYTADELRTALAELAELQERVAELEAAIIQARAELSGLEQVMA